MRCVFRPKSRAGRASMSPDLQLDSTVERRTPRSRRRGVLMNVKHRMRASDDRRRPEREALCGRPACSNWQAKRSATRKAERKQAHARACVVPKPRTRRDSAGQPPPAASASRRPTTSRSGTARHHLSDRQPNRGSQSTSRTSLRHRRAPQKRTRQKHHRRSRAFAASILRRTRPWPPIPMMCTTGPSARR